MNRRRCGSGCGGLCGFRARPGGESGVKRSAVEAIVGPHLDSGDQLGQLLTLGRVLLEAASAKTVQRDSHLTDLSQLLSFVDQNFISE
jgi:hypothetical protein